MHSLKYGFLLIGTIILFTTACNKDKENEVVLEFDITVPDDWQYTKASDNIVYHAVSPLNSVDDSIQEDLLVFRDPASGESLNSYYTAFIDNLQKEEGYQMLYTTDTSINGEDCKKFLHLQLIKGVDQNNDSISQNVKDMKYIFLRLNNAYIINCASLETTYDQYGPVFESIMSTFTFKN
jgi:hypothetical protein